MICGKAWQGLYLNPLFHFYAATLPMGRPRITDSNSAYPKIDFFFAEN